MSAFLYLSTIWGEKRVHLIKTERVILHVTKTEREKKGQQIHNPLGDAKTVFTVTIPPRQTVYVVSRFKLVERLPYKYK